MKVEVRYFWGREDFLVKTALNRLLHKFKPLASDTELINAKRFLEKEFSDDDFVRFTHAYLLWNRRLEASRKSMPEPEYNNLSHHLAVAGEILAKIIVARDSCFQREKKA
jgi:hypothetical protein